MSTSPAPTASRGDVTLQPSYFTSSLYVDPLRVDISQLIDEFTAQYALAQPPSQSFALFKRLWTELGWCWIHFKVFDDRARESFISVTERLFLERMSETEPPVTRVVALFALYTFYSTQPSTSTPALRAVKHIDIPIDAYTATVAIPSTLTASETQPLRPYATYVLTTLVEAQAFHILPHSELRPFKPSMLPRELFVQDSEDIAARAGASNEEGVSARPKKKGRPSKRDKAKKAKDALIALDKYMEKNSVTLPGTGFYPGIAPPGWPAPKPPQVTHTLITQPPVTTRNNYRIHKAQVLDVLEPRPEPSASSGRTALEEANDVVLTRLREIDALAAERGLEIGSEGGEKTGLARVEKAVAEMLEHGSANPWARGGILGLLEGAGLDFGETQGDPATT